MSNIVNYSSTWTWDTVLTSYARKVLKSQPVEQSYQHNATLAMMERSENIKVRGGGYFQCPVTSVTSALGGVVEKGTALSTADVDDTTMAEYRRVKYGEPVVLFESDEDDTRTPEALFDLLGHKVMQAKRRLENKIASDLWATTQQTSNGNNCLTGIPLHIEEAPISSGALGGLDGAAASQSFWRNQTTTTGGVASSVLMNQIDAIDYDLSAGGNRSWDFAITTKGLHKILKQVARTYGTVNLNPMSSAGRRIADLGFPVVEYDSKPIIWDRNCPSGYMYFVNKEAMKLAIMPGREFTLGPWARLEGNGQLGRIAYVRWTGQLVTFERRMLGQISGLTES
jgi:hypothetical protein